MIPGIHMYSTTVLYIFFQLYVHTIYSRQNKYINSRRTHVLYAIHHNFQHRHRNHKYQHWLHLDVVYKMLVHCARQWLVELLELPK